MSRHGIVWINNRINQMRELVNPGGMELCSPSRYEVQESLIEFSSTMSQIYLDYLGEIEIDDASYEDYISVIYNILDNIYPIKLCAICDKLITDNDFEKVLIDTDVSKTEVFVCNDCKDSMYCSIDNELLISSIKLTDGTVHIRYDGITTGYLQNGKINSLLYKKYSPEEYIYNYMYPDIAKEEIDYIVCDCTEKIYYVKGDTSKISGVYCPNCGKNVRGTFIEGETNMDKSNSYDIMPYSRSYGIELESARVISPKSIVRTVNFIEVYDGSCDGKEYVSGILRGDNGLADISEFLDSINESAPINKRSGFHVHFGLDDTERLDMELTKVLLLYYSIEQYMFSLLPKSRRDNRYCKSLSDIIGNHSCVSFIDMVNHNGFPEALYKYDSDALEERLRDEYEDEYEDDEEGLEEFIDERLASAPEDSQSERYNDARYTWVNFHSVYYRGTLEIRNHSATFNYDKISNWIILHQMILDFVFKSSLEDIINTVDRIYGSYPDQGNLVSQIIVGSTNVKLKTRTKLLKYLKERAEKFRGITGDYADREEEEEYMNDFILKGE